MMQLLDLPPELLASISQHLKDTDFFATRLAHTSLETASMTVFGRRYFRKKGFMITNASLDVLQSIAQSQKLRKYVQHVWFNPDCYTFIDPKCEPEMEVESDDAEDPADEYKLEIKYRFDLMSPDDRAKWDAYEEVMVDHLRLLEEGANVLQKRLEDALKLLPNVKILGMRRSEEHRPWGWRVLNEAVGEDPRILGPIPSQPSPRLSDPTKLFKALVMAAATAGTRLQRLYTDAVEVDNLPVQYFRESMLQRALQHMLYLEINASKAWLPFTSNPHYRVLRDYDQYGDGLTKVLKAAAPTMLELGLQIFPDWERRHAISANGSRWLDDYQFGTFQKIVENVHLTHLTRLKLEKVITTPTLLQSFLTPSMEKLMSLKMRDVRLLVEAQADAGKPWQSVFAFLHALPRLDFVLFHHLSRREGGITFAEPRASPTNQDHDAQQQAVGADNSGLNPSGGTFREYEDITLEARGREDVVQALERVVEHHWHLGNVYTFPMDEEVWHTDTSDEEW